jgi:DNA gyrase subunit A
MTNETKKVILSEYYEYQIYTLKDRAIPYSTDGLKPGQRRALWILYKNLSKGLLKVASAAGYTLTLHPHGNTSVESTLVKLSQDYVFANNYPLIEGKGSFGERMETTPAAARYIECKLGEIAKLLLLGDLNQVNMIPSYDEKDFEPEFFLPKLPLVLLNGAEGIASGYRTNIPSFHHKDICKAMIQFLEGKRVSKLIPKYRGYTKKVLEDDGKFYTELGVSEVKGKFYITELPRGMDAKKINQKLGDLIEEGSLKDYLDRSKKNNVNIELVFHKGRKLKIADIESLLETRVSFSPVYNLIKDNTVWTFNDPREYIEIFTKERLKVVKRRYELLLESSINAINKSNEIIRFIEEKHFEKAHKLEDRKTYIEYLKKKKFVNCDYLADMSIYRMTKKEVKEKKLLVKDETQKMKEFKKIFKSKERLTEKLIEEIQEVSSSLSKWEKKNPKL